MIVCKKHKRYKAIKKPVSTTLHPGGCQDCLKIYKDKNFLEESGRQTKKDVL